MENKQNSINGVSETHNVPLYTKIDSNIKQRAETYVYESKQTDKKDTDSMKKLFEIALDYYMIHKPIITMGEVIPTHKLGYIPEDA